MVELNNFSFTYALGREPALKNINLNIRRGEFLTLCGASGSGKSTLLRSLKQAIAPVGTRSGTAKLCKDKNVAIVFQNPETQVIMADVISDLAFQSENRGIPPALIKRRMSETVSFFGLGPLLHKKPANLSGGQKQMVALAAALMCEPELLLLDEPISQLDPLAASAFLNAAQSLNREFGVTVVMAEHRLDECVSVTDRVAFMDAGEIKYEGETREALKFFYHNGFRDFVPSLPRLSLASDGRVTLTPREFRENYKDIKVKEITSARRVSQTPARVLLADVSAGFESKKEPVLKRLDFTAGHGETVCVLGGNGGGKSTLLKTIAGVIKPFAGKARTDGKIAYMPQNVRDFFLYDTVRANMSDLRYAEVLEITPLLDKNPFDLSGGEQQKCALAAMLSRNPDICLLDEPTKGMDAGAKKQLGRLLKDFNAKGGTVVTATHDMEFAATWADSCAMLFNGEIATRESAREFFTGNKYYTTAVHKALRHINPLVMAVDDV